MQTSAVAKRAGQTNSTNNLGANISISTEAAILTDSHSAKLTTFAAASAPERPKDIPRAISAEGITTTPAP